MTGEQARDALRAAILESARLVRLPATHARRARQAQLDREKRRLLRIIQDKGGLPSPSVRSSGSRDKQARAV